MIEDKVAFLGPQGTFSHEAASLVSDNLISYCSIQQVMGAVESGDCVCGIVPIENSIEGPVSLTLDSLIHNFDLKIKNEIVIPINHNLLAAKEMTVDEVENVYSHSQALEQCRTYLNEKFADVEKIPVSSTSYAASLAQKESDTACICNEICKDLYDLEIVSDNIQDIKDNKTRFIVLSKAKNSRETKKTSIVFSTKDEPGALYKILGMFSIAEINLTKIESRPAKTKLGDYIFFVDLEGDEKDPKIKLTLDNIANLCDEFRILGSY